jgi:hypothetical protein
VSEEEQMASTLGPAPDPEAVLRGHRAAVNVVTFHSPSGTLLSGYKLFSASQLHLQ